VDDHLELL